MPVCLFKAKTQYVAELTLLARFAALSSPLAAIAELPTLQRQSPVSQKSGFNDSRAKRSTGGLIRLDPDGRVSRKMIPVDFAWGTGEQSNPILRETDFAAVDRSNSTRFIDNINKLFSPAAAALTVRSIPARIVGVLDRLGIIDRDDDDDD